MRQSVLPGQSNNRTVDSPHQAGWSPNWCGHTSWETGGESPQVSTFLREEFQAPSNTELSYFHQHVSVSVFEQRARRTKQA